MNDKMYILDDDDVMIVFDEFFKIGPYHTMRSTNFLAHIQQPLISNTCNRVGNDLNKAKEIVSAWLEDGADCQILVPEKAWQKGKIRLALVFEPEEEELEEVQEVENKEPESLLDDIRQSIQSQKNSGNEA